MYFAQAQEPSDYIWENLGHSKINLFWRRFISTIVQALCIAFGIFVIAITKVLSVSVSSIKLLGW